MAAGEPPVLSVASSWKTRLKGWIFATMMFTSSLFGALYILVPMTCAVVMWPKHFRKICDRMVGLWLILPSGLLKLFYGVNVSVIGDEVDHSEPALIIMNHRTRLDWLFFWTALYQQDPWLLTSEKISLKGILKYVPGSGWAMQMNTFIFLDRTFESDRRKFDDILTYYSNVGYNYQILLFPEGTDKCPRATERSRIHAEKKGLTHYDYVLHPRVTGFVHMIQKMRQDRYIRYLYDVTVGFGDAIVQSEAGLVVEGLVPTDVHYQVIKIDIKDLPLDDAGLGEWLIRRWEEKEEKLRTFYSRSKTETFPNTPNGRKYPMTERNSYLQNVIVFTWIFVTVLWAIGYLFLPFQWIYSIFGVVLLASLQYIHGGCEWFVIKSFSKTSNR